MSYLEKKRKKLCFVSGPGSSPGSHTISLQSFSPVFVCLSWLLHFWSSYRSVTLQNIFQLHLSRVSSWLDSGYAFLTGILQSVSQSVVDMCTIPVMGFRLLKVTYAKFLYYEVSFCHSNYGGYQTLIFQIPSFHLHFLFTIL